jgi:transcriptional regulator with XRE-family HTH domain
MDKERNDYNGIVIGNIEAHIKKSGYKKQFVAERSGLSKCEFSNILHGRKVLRVDVLFKIAEVLDVPPEDFLKYPGNHRIYQKS